jgi:sodium-dependent dicarboxylate transporter 2/3/5
MDKMYICIIIFILSMISYIINKLPMALTALLTLAALMITGCLDTATAISGFSNGNTILIISMFVIAAGLNRTQFVDKLSSSIVTISGGKFKRAYLGYIILTTLLTSFLTSPMVSFAIVFPLAAASCKEFNVSPSKVMFPLAVTSIGCCGILPFGYAIVATGQYNGFLETYGFTGITMNPIDFTKGRLPLMFIILLWAYFIAPKFAPDEPVIPLIETTDIGKRDKQPLKALPEAMGYLIFFAVVLMLIFGSKTGIPSWKVAFIGALLVVTFGVLSEKEAITAMPLSIAFMYVGALAMGNALNSTGAGEVVGDFLANLVGGTQNNFLLGALFFTIPFIVTQFMLNQAVMNVFVPICLLTSKSLGANPIGLMILITAGSLTAFMTPMATPAIPLAMGAGGYDVRSLFKQGWLISILLIIGYISYTMIIFPAF